jgi:hypothetical protein
VDLAALVLAAVALLYPLQSDLNRITRAIEEGAGGYNTTSWQSSATIRYFRQNRGDFHQALYSNAPDALFVLADIEAQSIVPKFRYASTELANDPVTLTGAYPPEPGLLVWLHEAAREDFLFTLEELSRFTELQLITELEDGAVYSMDRKKREP